MEQDLIKDFFIAKMNNTTIQMELLSEVRTPAQVVNFALSRERGQANQKKFSAHRRPIGTIKLTPSPTTTHAPDHVLNINKASIQSKQTNNAEDAEVTSQQVI